MTKKEFLDVFNGIDDEFINEIIDIPEKNSGDIADELPENIFSELSDDRARKIYLTKKRVPFWKIALSSAAAVCVLTTGIFAAVKLHGVQATPNDSTAANSGGVDLSNVAESSLPIINTIPKIKRVDDEGYEFKFKLGGTVLKQFSVPAVKNDFENCSVFHLTCRGVSRENPLRIWIFLTENGETVERVNSLTITEEGSKYYTVPYDSYSLKYGEECVICAVVDDEAYVGGKWLP